MATKTIRPSGTIKALAAIALASALNATQSDAQYANAGQYKGSANQQYSGVPLYPPPTAMPGNFYYNNPKYQYPKANDKPKDASEQAGFLIALEAYTQVHSNLMAYEAARGIRPKTNTQSQLQMSLRKDPTLVVLEAMDRESKELESYKAQHITGAIFTKINAYSKKEAEKERESAKAFFKIMGAELEGVAIMLRAPQQTNPPTQFTLKADTPGGTIERAEPVISWEIITN